MRIIPIAKSMPSENVETHEKSFLKCVQEAMLESGSRTDWILIQNGVYPNPEQKNARIRIRIQKNAWSRIWDQLNAWVRIRIFSEPESENWKEGWGGGVQDLPTWIEKELALQYTLIVDIIKFFWADSYSRQKRVLYLYSAPN
jgi:hypothetical protein